MTVSRGRSIGAGLAVTGLVLGAIGIAWFATRRAPRAADPEPVEPGASVATSRTAELAPAAAPTPRSAEPLAEDPTTPGRTIEVLVRAHARFDPASDPTPGVVLEIGVGDPFEPLDAVTALTGSDGRVVVTLGWTPGPHEYETYLPVVWARPLDPALRSHLVRQAVPPDATQVELSVWAGAGTWIRGRVVSAEGEVVSATVRLAEDDAWANTTSAIQNFELEAHGPGPWTLFADAGTHGTGLAKAYPAPAGRPPLPVELRVAGPGVVCGRLVDGRGEALVGHGVLVKHADADDLGSIGSGRLAEVLNLWRTVGGGQIVGEARSDGEGRFVVRGLAAGLYRLLASPDGRSFMNLSLRNTDRKRLVVLTPEPIPADGFERTFELRRPHLVVHLVDPGGRPFAGEFHVRPPRRGSSAPPGARLELLVLELGAEGRTARRIGEVQGDGGVLFELESDRTYRVALVGARQPWRPVDVAVTPDDDRIERTLVVEPPGVPGTLVVRRVDGAPAFCSAPKLTVACPETGVVVAREELGAETRVELPPGRWRVTVEDAPVRLGWHGTPLAEPCVGPFETEVDMVAGRERTVLVAPPAGARLAVSIAGAPDASDWRALEMEGAPDRGWDPATRVTLRLLAPRHAAVPVWFLWKRLEPPGLEDALALGESATSWIVPAGRWMLEGRLPGGRVARTEVVLVDGETTEARLVFE